MYNITRFMVWFAMFNDYLDKNKNMRNHWIQIFRGQEESNDEIYIEKIYKKLIYELFNGLTKVQKERLIEALVKYTEIDEKTLEIKCGGKKVSLEEYLNIRRFDIGIIPSYIIAEYGLGLDIDTSFFCKTHLFGVYHNCLADHWLYVNDLYSLSP